MAKTACYGIIFILLKCSKLLLCVMMNKMNFAIILSMVLLIFFGCTSQSSNSFIVGEQFGIMASQVFTNDSNFVRVTLLEITDSRCPLDVECIWAGELGALVNVKQFSDNSFSTILADENINLGLTTRKVANVLNNNFSITLNDINKDSNQILIQIDSVNSSSNNNEKEWFVISPKQCQSNLWDAWAQETGIMIKKSADVSMDEVLIPIWLNEVYQINVYESKSHISAEVVCQACSCSTGEQVAVLVDSNSKTVLNNLGFSMIQSPIACTMDARVCSDGSAVGRTAPFCDFEKCPIGGNTDSNNSADENVLITVTKVPGFMINPSTKVITIGRAYFVVDESARVWDEALQDWNESFTSQSNTLEISDFDNLVSFIKGTNFFDLTEDDVRMCIADISTTNIKITIGNKTNFVYSIGAECDKNKTADVYSILERIDALTDQGN